MPNFFIRGALGACLLTGVSVAQVAPAQIDEEPPLEEIIVSGEFAGPGMWKVTRADDPAGHTLWIIGDPPPLPKRLSWRSNAVESVVLRSQEILRDATVNLAPDEKIGLFKGLSLLPAAMKARKNPDEQKLETLVPADVYARWRVQKKLYLGHDSGVENWRPLFAADKLRKAAVDKLNLREGGMVWDVVEKLAKKHKIRTTTPTLKFTIKSDEIKDQIKAFSRESLADADCFAATLSLTEAWSNREVEAARARAWATADLAGLEALPPLPNPGLPCIVAIMGSQVAKEHIPADIREQLYALWIADAERAIGANQTTFAIVPLAKLTRDEGYLTRLRAKGYVIDAPR
jgi:hypothetical protein